MSNETTIQALPPDERARLRKQLSEQAVKHAVSSRWDDAVATNREILRLFPDDADSLNRLGKALSEVGQVSEARKAYGRAIAIDPTNTIARRNLDRLASVKDAVVAAQPPSQLDTRLFVEESGKASAATLQAVDPARAKLLDAGDLLQLQVQGNAVNVLNMKGEYVGLVDPRVGLRMARMIAAGNQYTAALITNSGDIKVMLRETFQSPAMAGRVSFPQSSRTNDVRGYTRRGLLRGEEMEFSDDDDPYEEEEEDRGWTETSEDDAESPTVEVDINTGDDDDSFD
ncbi:MAG: tetratricopeptide repeat protein [Dehalococcoidia bacterium]